MSFKDRIRRDIHRVFLNPNAFAEKRTVIYDGVVYSGGGEEEETQEPEGIPVVLTAPAEHPRERLRDDHVQGLRRRTVIFYCARQDLGGLLPEQGKSLEISPREGESLFRKYYIAASSDEMGMLRLELEELDG